MNLSFENIETLINTFDIPENVKTILNLTVYKNQIETAINHLKKPQDKRSTTEVILI